MPLRRLLHIPRRALRLALYGAVLGLIVFVFLTRTQVGRDELRDEIERQFGDRFDGRLEIGTLKGNLLNQLFAGQVRLYDPAGNVVLSVDSVVVRPSWHDLLRRTVSAPHVRLVRPELHLVRHEDGTWSVANAFRTEALGAIGEDPPSRWSFTSAEVVVEDGLVTTRNLGAPPALVADSVLFDYANAEARAIQARAVVELDPDLKLVDVLHLSARTPGLGFDLDALQGQFVFEGGRLAANGLTLRAGDTRLDLTGAYDVVAPAHGARQLDLTLAESRLAFDQLRRVFPRLPLADAAILSARVHGPLSDLEVASLDIARGASRLVASGSVRGLPDSLAFHAAAAPSTLTLADLQALLPGLDLERASKVGTLRLTAEADGAVDLGGAAGPMTLDTRIDVRSEAGGVQGSVGARRDAAGRWSYGADLEARALDLRRLTGDAAFASDLNGRLAGKGSGRSLHDADGTFTLRLAASRLAGRSVDSLNVDLSASEGRFDVRGMMLQFPGAASFDGHLDVAGDMRAYRLQARTYRLDLGRLLATDSLQSQLNATITLDATGRSLDDVGGTLDVALDASTITQHGTGRQLPPHRFRLALAQHDTPRPYLELTGDLATVRVEGDVALEPLVALARLWGASAASTIAAELNKPYRDDRTAAALPAEDPLDPVVSEAYLRPLVRRRLAAVGLDAQTLRAELQVHRADLLAAYLPTLPPLATDAHATLRLTADADRLTMDASLAADSLRLGPAGAPLLDAADVRFNLTTSAHHDDAFPGTLRETFVTTVEAEATRLQVAGQRFEAPRVVARYADAAAHIDVVAREAAAAPLRLSARLDLLPDRNRLTLTDVHLAAEGYTWSSAGTGLVDVYEDAVIFPGLTFENRSDAGEAPQRIRIDGIVSRAPQDTLYVTAENILLRRISELAKLKRTVGGRLDGRLALTGFGRQPEVTGDVDIATLSFDNRILGRVSLQSRYVPGRPDVALELALRPDPADTLLAFVPGTRLPAVHEEHRLRLAGTFRLPHLGGSADARDPGALDLRLDVDRADAFFFDYIFPDVVAGVEGGLSGSVAVGGSFFDPLFEGSVALEGGRLDVPKFNLHYAADGSARLDGDGIHLDGVTLRDPTGGSAVVTGGILFNDYRFFSFDLTARLDELQIIDVLNARDLAFYGQIWASGTTTVTGPVSNVLLRSTDAVTTPASNVFIPITATGTTSDVGFIVFADSTGRLPDLGTLHHRDNLFAQRPAGERTFLDGLEMDLNILAPDGSTVNLVIDPLVGDVIRAVGGGRIQLQRTEGEFFTYGALEVTSGDYLFSAGELFYRRFLIDSGTLTWDGDPLNASLDLTAAYRTRASTAGLPSFAGTTSLIPLIVRLHVTGRVATPAVDLRLALDRNDRSNLIGNQQAIEAVMNQPETAAQYATSVLLTNSFLLTTALASETDSDRLADTRNQLAFNSLSQLVASQLNRYLNQALPNLDLNFGVQGESARDLDVTYGVALRLLDERLVIRGEGLYQNDQTQNVQQGLFDEFVVEVRLNPSISLEVFYRREDDLLSAEPLSTSSTTGAGLSYETQFSTWDRLWHRLFGWLLPDPEPETPPPPDQVAAVEE